MRLVLDTSTSTPFGRMQICAKAKSAAMMTQTAFPNPEPPASLRIPYEETPERDMTDVDSSVLIMSSSRLMDMMSLGGELLSFVGVGYRLFFDRYAAPTVVVKKPKALTKAECALPMADERESASTARNLNALWTLFSCS